MIERSGIGRLGSWMELLGVTWAEVVGAEAEAVVVEGVEGGHDGGETGSAET